MAELRQSYDFDELFNDLGLIETGDIRKQIGEHFAQVQSYRYKVENSGSIAVTRTSALVVCLENDPRATELFKTAGLNYTDFTSKVGFAGKTLGSILESAVPKNKPVVHYMMGEALSAFANRAESYQLSYLWIAAAIVADIERALRTKNRGELEEHLVSSGCVLTELITHFSNPELFRMIRKDDSETRSESESLFDFKKSGDNATKWFSVLSKDDNLDTLKSAKKYFLPDLFRHSEAKNGDGVLLLIRVGWSETTGLNLVGSGILRSVGTENPVVEIDKWMHSGFGVGAQFFKMIKAWDNRKDALVAMPERFYLEVPSSTQKNSTEPLVVEPEIAEIYEEVESGGEYLEDDKTLTENEGFSRVELLGDAARTNVDHLDRADLAFMLAARLNRIWYSLNKPDKPGNSQHISNDSFVVHIDAQWGGGKTTFANYVAKILSEKSTSDDPPEWMQNLPMDNERDWPRDYQRPWYVVSFNAWEHQHVTPPWWCFYTAIREQCIGHIGRDDWKETSDSFPRKVSVYISSTWLGKWFKKAKLNLRFFAWKSFHPERKSALLVVGIVAAIVILFQWLGVLVTDQENLQTQWAVNLYGFGRFVVAALAILYGAPAVLSSLVSNFMKGSSVGTASSENNYSMGAEDPLLRFRKHFDATISSLDRPVLVIIDDIDRCDPAYIVELIRGIQTVMKCSRVVFLILGDRDWIEKAFASCHKEMESINVGGEHDFGGRFVEKAIQLSLVLTPVGEDKREAYVRSLLQGESTTVEGQESDAPLFKPENKYLETVIATILDTDDVDFREQQVQELVEELPENSQSEVREINRRMALRSAADEKVDDATHHRLLPIAAILPSNPRQIKRIINSIGLIQEIARIEKGITPGSAQWFSLALWVVMMTSWPKTWATLARHPQMLDRVRAIAESDLKLEQSSDSIELAARTIANSPDVMKVIEFSSSHDAWHNVMITKEDIESFNDIVPAMGGNSYVEG